MIKILDYYTTELITAVDKCIIQAKESVKH